MRIVAITKEKETKEEEIESIKFLNFIKKRVPEMVLSFFFESNRSFFFKKIKNSI